VRVRTDIGSFGDVSHRAGHFPDAQMQKAVSRIDTEYEHASIA
jgi:hypothetical protein